MGILNNLRNSRQVKNALQEHNGFRSDTGYNDSVYTRNINYNELFYGGLNKTGKYDNYYGDSNRIVSVASQYPLFYTDSNNYLVDPKPNTFAYYLENLNDSYPQKKILEQIYTELTTHGHSDVFLWREDGKKESRQFDNGKKYDEDLFRGLTLVSGYDKWKLTNKDKDNIVRLTLGASQANVFMGYSPSQAANSWRKMQDEMGLHMTAFARNAGMPIGKFIITAPSPEEYLKLRQSLDDKVSGAKNSGKILYDYRPSEAKQSQIEWVQFTSQDVQDYTPSLEFAEKKMSQTFGVPGTIKGTNDKESYATARVAEQVFIKYTIKPLVDSLKEQLEFAIRRRFNLTGEIQSNVVIPEIADESLVKIRATERQVILFDQKVSEGYTPESIVAAYDLPESFLMLEKTSSANNKTETSVKGSGHAKKKIVAHSHKGRDEFYRPYKNELTKKEIEALEDGYRNATTDFADKLFENGASAELDNEYKGRMAAHFESEYKKIYNKTVDDVADALLDELESVDISELDLTPEELEQAKAQYEERVADFSKTFTEGIESLIDKGVTALEGDELYRVDRVVVTESEHTRIVSELGSWTKAQEEFPVRVYKTWKALPDACPECLDIDGTTLDVTALFIDNPTNEIYEVQGGGLHPNCRCLVLYEMNAEEL